MAWLTRLSWVLPAALGWLAGCQPGDRDPFTDYTGAIDAHVASYVAFNEPDAAMRDRILADYTRARKLRDEYHASGRIAADPLVSILVSGANSIEMGNSHVALLLAEGPDLECPELVIDKPAGAPGHFIVIGGSREFWVDRSTSAKFISAEFTLPEEENSLHIQSRSWSPGKIVIAFIAGAVLTLSGCEDPGSGAPPVPAPPPAPGVCATVPALPMLGAAFTITGVKCAVGAAACTDGGVTGGCRTSGRFSETLNTFTFRCRCK